ncbi:MAG: UxaA family hydrolase [Candidatus Korobacteraceae bacterium]
MRELTGYRDADGRVGIRKHVLILSLMSFCNRATELIAQSVRGTLPLVHPHGSMEIGVYRERLDRCLQGVALNPDVHSVLVVGYESKATASFVEGLRKLSRKPIDSVLLPEGGTSKAVWLGTEKAIQLVTAASETHRQRITMQDLVVGVKCGGSDATSGIASNAAVGVAVDRIIESGGTVIFSETTEILGAEHILARRAKNDSVAQKITRAVQENEQMAMAAGIDLMGINPVPDNIRGGISTIEEKSLGAILKTGTSPVEDVLGYAEAPCRPGLYFMDSPSAATEVMTALAAAGAQLILFSTGVGNPAGNLIAPVLKITSNPRSVARVSEHIDVDISDVLGGTMSIPEAGERVLDMIAASVNGRVTKSEVIGHLEFAPVAIGL